MGKKIIITGGGAIGCSIAYFLSLQLRPDVEIWVVEKDSSYQRSSSALSASSIRQQFSTPVCIQLSQFGYEFLDSCERQKVRYGTGVDLVGCGYLFLGSATQAGDLRRRTELVKSLGGSVREIAIDKLAQRYSWMSVEDLAYAVEGLAGEGWFDGYSLLQWYRKRALEAGVQFITGEVAGYHVAADRITHLELSDGSRLCGDQFVIAAGAWSAALGNSLGVPLPVRARRRTVFVVSCPTAISELPILIDTSGVYLRREQKHFLCTISPAPDLDFDDLPLQPNLEEFEEIIWPALAKRIPAFDALRVEHAWAGYYEYNTRDQNGIVGRLGPRNSYVATGFSGHGLMHSPGVGRAVAELLTYGEYRSLDLSPLSPERFVSGDLLIETAVY